MRDFEYHPIDPKRTFSVVMLAFLVSFAASNADDINGSLIFLLCWAMFFLGWTCVFAARKDTARERLTFEPFEESDWRHFEVLNDLSGMELEELRAVCKSPIQLAEAERWLMLRFRVTKEVAGRLHEFFVRSGWANSNELSEDWLGYSWPSQNAGCQNP